MKTFKMQFDNGNSTFIGSCIDPTQFKSDYLGLDMNTHQNESALPNKKQGKNFYGVVNNITIVWDGYNVVNEVI